MKAFAILLLGAAVEARFVIPSSGYGSPAPAAPVFKPQPLPQPLQFSPISSIFKPVNRDCVYQDWSDYSACSAVACGTAGFRTRTRSIIKEAAGFGQPCDQSKLSESIPCSARPCQDCVAGQWSAWSTCSASCGSGTQSRSKPTLTPHEGTGAGCDDFETQPCFLQSCAVHCEMSPWSQWSDCSASCENGQRQRLRSILVQPLNGGRQCGPLEEWEDCNAGPCPIPCLMGEWGVWSACPACGEPTSRTRSRSIIQAAAFGGAQCADLNLFDTAACNISPCPVDCQVSSWSQFSDCSATCDQGQRQRVRNIIVQPAYGGVQCPPLQETESCNLGSCAIDCQMTEWSQWSACSSTCDNGKRQRIRSVLVQPSNGGLQCPPAEEWGVCNAGPCPVHCAYAEWTAWTPCPSCGNANRFRSREILQQSQFGGAQCDFSGLQQSESCNLNPCPVDCVMSQWSLWSDCSATCGEGRRQRLRNIITQAAYGGKACEPVEAWETCSLPSCEVHCQVSEWSEWSACSAVCGPGSQSRTRSLLTRPENGGELCPPLEDWRKCNNPCGNPLPVVPVAPVAPIFNLPLKSLPAPPAPPAPVAPSFPTFAAPVAAPPPPPFKKPFFAPIAAPAPPPPAPKKPELSLFSRLFSGY